MTNIYFPGPRGNSQFPDNNEDEAHDYTEGEVEPGDIYLKPNPLNAESLEGPYSGNGEGTIYIAERINGKIVWKKIGKYTKTISRYNGKPGLLKILDTEPFGKIKIRVDGSEREIDTRNYFPPPWPNRVWIPVKKFAGRIHFEPYGGLDNDGYTWPNGTEGPYPYDAGITDSDRKKYRIQANSAVKNSIIIDLANDQANANSFIGTSIVTTDTNQEYIFNNTTLTFVETAFKDLVVIPNGNVDIKSGSTIKFSDGSVQTTGWTKSAAQVQSTPPASPVTGQLYYDTDDGRTYIYTGAAWIDANPAGAGGGGGSVDLDEPYGALSSATGVVVHDCTTNRLFYHTSITANFTANFTNLNLSVGRATSVTLVLVQGATARMVTAVQISGAAQTINWQGSASAPAGTASRTEAVTFSIINVGGSFTVLGIMTSFGGA